ncbi:MAG: rhodanese-like domain-containing protein [Pseudomonadota bacterium]
MKHTPQFLKIVTDAKERITEISINEVAAKIERNERFILVDVREDGEWITGHIKGAIHIGKGVIERDIERLVPDASEEIVLYCGGGYRSALAADNLQKMGYTDVSSMDGGWRGWNDKSLPTEKPKV